MRVAIGLFSCLLLVSCQSTTRALDEVTPADEFWVMRVTTSNTCRVQKSTEAPVGAKYKGPYASRDTAKQEMCSAYDSTMTDTTKCWVFVPADSCS